MWRKSGVGLESRGGPFPHLAETDRRSGRWLRLRQRGHFPLELSRQAPTGPLAPGLRLVPGQIGDRRRLIERGPLAEPALLPAATVRPPHARTAGVAALAPGPALGTPVAALLVSTARDERRKGSV